jgi:hypothetical protein
VRKPVTPVLGLFLALLLPAGAAAQAPVRTEELIYTILAFNGKDYSATFARESSDAIYILAGVDSFLSARKTLVYFWPITGEWKTDTDSLNWFFPGTLELRDRRGRVQELPLQKFTYYNVKGEYELNWKVAVGEAAAREYNRYQELYQDYFKAVNAYQKANSDYDASQDALLRRIMKIRKEGGDPAELVKRLGSTPRPTAPEPPKDYVVPPSPAQDAFILNLPRGEYWVRLRNPDGTVMEGSERRIVVHERRRASGIGYEVIPADKWTRPEQSTTPSSVLHVNGTTDLYLRPFFQDEFAELAYARTVDNAARGNPNVYNWVRTQQVPHASIEVQTPAGPTLLGERPYFVEQTKGSTLGYTIVPFDPQGAHKGKDPNLIAFRVAIGKDTRELRLRALDGNGKLLPGSERQIRVIRGAPSALLLILLAALPLVAMALVLGVRSRRYSA